MMYGTQQAKGMKQNGKKYGKGDKTVCGKYASSK